MPGARLTHPTAKSCIFLIEDMSQPYPVPFLCPTCARTHLHKAHHLEVDGDGAVIVALPMWEHYRTTFTDSGFVFANEVVTPPTQMIGFNAGAVRQPAVVTFDPTSPDLLQIRRAQ